MAERIIPAKAETRTIAHLSGRMPGVDVCGFRLGAPKHRQVQIRKTGGWPVDPAVDTAQLTVTCWGLSGDDEDACEDLANTALSWLKLADMEGFLDGSPMRNLRIVSAPYPDPDPTTGRARCSFTIAADLRGTIAA